MSFSVSKDNLPSGLTVITIDAPHLHSLMCAVYVRIGSRHETPETNGVSHFLEHLFFRGTQRYTDSVRMNAEVEGVGGNLNGVTMRDSSYFYTPAHADGLELVTDVLGEMMTRPHLRHLATEKKVILEEMLDEVDERGRDIDVDNLSKAVVYAHHPLALKIAGTPASVRRLKLGDVRAHFKRAYVGGNMVLAVAGPASRRRVVAAAKRAFRHLPAGHRQAEAPPIELQPTGPVLKYVNLDEPQVEFRLTFPTVAEHHPDAVGLGLLRRVLDDGLSSRLPHNIVEKKGLAYSVGATIETFHDAGTFEIEGATAPENLADVLEEILRTLGTLRSGRIAKEELRRAQTRLSMHLDFLQDSPGDLCGWFGGAELFRPAESFAERKAQAKQVTLADLKRLALRWLGPERLVVVGVGPGAAKRKAQAIIHHASRWLK